MVQLKEAVQQSKSYLSEIFPVSYVKDFQLEGVELTDDEKYWQVTFSYYGPEEPPKGEPDFATPLFKTYKTVKVRASDGALFGVKNGLL
jgi:hypothetical protein